MAVAQHIDQVRAFNRFYTEVLGLLEEGLLDTPFSLPESRVIFELGSAGDASPTSLGATLQLDLGYVSRLAAKLKQRGLVTAKTSENDRRKTILSLTNKGRRAFAELDAKSSGQIRELLDRLSQDGQERLVACTKEIQELFVQERASAVVLREPHSGDFGWVVQRHGDLYRREYGWDESFEGLVARIVADYIEHRDPKREAAWIAEIDGQRVGCVFCTKKNAQLAQLRILLVEPSARGRGIGARLVEECIRFARRAGYQQMMLWTNDVLESARRIYEAAGFYLVEEEKHQSFGADLVGQNWYLDL